MGKNIALRAQKPLYRIETTLNILPTCNICFFRLAKPMFLLSLISKHGMLRVVLVMTDGSLLTISQQQRQTQILKRLKSMKGFFMVFVSFIQNRVGE
jgi:hypothetical protein